MYVCTLYVYVCIYGMHYPCMYVYVCMHACIYSCHMMMDASCMHI